MVVDQRQFIALQQRISPLIAIVDGLAPNRLALSAAVDGGLLDGLVERGQLSDWVDLVAYLLGDTEDTNRLIGWRVIMVAQAVERQVERLLPHPADRTDGDVRIAARWGLAVALLRWGETEAAEAERIRAIEVSRRFGDSRIAGICRLDYALALDHRGETERALAENDAALSSLRVHGQSAEYATALVNHANYLVVLDRPAEALLLCEEAAPLLDTEPRPSAYVSWLVNHANALRDVGRPFDALPLYEAASALLRTIGDPASIAICLTNHAEALTLAGRRAEAFALAEQAMPLIQEHGSTVLHAQFLFAHGTILLAFGRDEESLPLYAAARTLFDVYGRLAESANCLVGSGCALQGLGRCDEALLLFQSAAPVLRSHGKAADYAGCLMNHANTLMLRDRGAEALPLFQEAVPLLEEHDSPVEAARGLTNLATALRTLGREREALPLYDEAVVRCRIAGPPADDLRWVALIGLAVVWLNAGNTAEATPLVEEALDIVERLGDGSPRLQDRLGLRETFADVYRLAIDLDLDARNVAAAYDHLQQAKGRSLVELLELRSSAIPGGKNANRLTDLAWEEHAIVERSACSGALPDDLARIEILRHERTLLAQQMRTESPERALLTVGAVRPLADIAAVLEVGEALVDFIDLGTRFNNRIAAFVVLPGVSPLQAWLLDGAELDAALAEWGKILKLATSPFGWVGEVPVTVHNALYDLLIHPLASFLRDAGIHRLIISASGRLHRVPFAALWYPVGDGVRYLCDDFTLVGTPTATSLWLLRQHEPIARSPRVLAVAPFAAGEQHRDLAGSIAGLHNLAHSHREVLAVADIARKRFPAEPHAVLTRVRATRQHVLALAPASSLLLIATHGASPEAGQTVLGFRLILRPEDEDVSEPAALSVLEIFEGALRLNAFQVVLSACHLGDVVLRGEEALGFNQAFLSAGARVVLAPLWVVDDETTADLSIAYHRELLGEERPTVAEAMQRAMREIRAQPGRAHPFFWAAMLPVGDGALRLPT